jgi:hypothetical protein
MAGKTIASGLHSTAYTISAGSYTVTNYGTVSVTNPIAIDFTGEGGVLIDAGGVTGASTAVAFAAGKANRVILDPGAGFGGLVDGGNTIGAAAYSTLELASGTTAGTLTGLGTQFIDFAQVTIDSGASWYLAPGNTLAPGITLTSSGALINQGSLGGNGVTLGPGGSLVNLIAGAIDVLGNAVSGAGGANDVINHGGITSNDGYGVGLPGGGSVTNYQGAMIAGVSGIPVSGAPGSTTTTAMVTNAGSITSNSQGVGVFLDNASGGITNLTGGMIAGY